MPAKNAIKLYVPNAFYHIYNRGVERRLIFVEDSDYKKFLRCIAEATFDGNTGLRRVEVHAFCLMPNHFHLLIKQGEDERSISDFMQRVTIKYAMYFNWKYGRVGHLFQGRYKAVRIETDGQYQYIFQYIHNNPIALGADTQTYLYSSQRYHNSIFCPPWLIIGSDPTLD